jgi:hypothetical protein
VSGGHAGDGLSALVDGELDPDEEAAVRAHVAECPMCEEELEDIRRSRRVVRLLPAVDVPDEITDRLFAVGDSVVSVLGPRRRLAAAVAVAASVAALALVGGPADTGPQPVTASLTGAMRDHVETQAAAFVPSEGTTAPRTAVDRLRAPYRAPVHLDEDWDLVEAFRRADGLQLLYRRGLYSLSVFEREGALDRDALPDDGKWVDDGGEAAWQLVSEDGTPTVVVLDRSDLTLTMVGDAPAEDVLRAARSFPDARGLPMVTRLRRACADALRALSPL